VVGTSWLYDMFFPKWDSKLGKFLIRASGNLAGGHAYLLDGVNTQQGLVRIKNSWGRDWGHEGFAYMPLPDLEMLIADGGEACLAVEVAT